MVVTLPNPQKLLADRPNLATVAYGLFLAFGGVIGFLSKGSLESLVVGLATGGALVAFGVASHVDQLENLDENKFKSPSYPYLAFSALCSSCVSLLMLDRFLDSGKVFPSGVVALISLGMTSFYAWRMFGEQDVGSYASRSIDKRR